MCGKIIKRVIVEGRSSTIAKQFNNNLTDPIYSALRLPSIWGLVLPRKELFYGLPNNCNSQSAGFF